MSYTPEQERAIMHDKGDILLSASAGSGKTFVMIERLIRLIIEDKTTVERVLALTFTKLAASEMKEKLVTAMTKKINAEDTSAERAARLKEQLSSVPTADISTFDSYCNNLIKRYFYELGIDSSFIVADSSQSKILSERAMDKTFDELYGEGNDSLRYLLKLFVVKRNDKSLRNQVQKLYDFADKEAYPERFVDDAVGFYSEQGFERIKVAYFEYYRPIFEEYERYFGEFRLSFEGCQVTLYAHACEVEALIQEAFLQKDIIGFARVLSTYTASTPRLSKKNPYDEEAYRRYLTMRKSFNSIVQKISESFATASEDEMKQGFLENRKIAECFREVYTRFKEEYTRIKREENVLDFPDLEHFALKLLDNDRIREEISSQYDYIFADEYQDTSGVQEEILRKLSTDNLFMVGDLKQCIYAFRGCNPDIFVKRQREFANGLGTNMQLTRNFRSSKAVLACVNGIFSEIMTKQTEGTDYKNAQMTVGNGVEGEAYYVFQNARKSSKNNEVQARGVYSVKNNLSTTSEEKEMLEGREIVSIIRDLVGKTITVEDDKQITLGYKDIVIVTRSLSDYGNLLSNYLTRHDIPVTTSADEDITVFPETSMLISFVKLMHSAEQDVPLVAVMHGPIGRFTDEELAEIRSFYSAVMAERAKKTKDFSYKRAPYFAAVRECALHEEFYLCEKIRELLSLIERYRLLADYVCVGELLQKLVIEKDIDVYYATFPDRDNRIARINKLINNGYAGGKMLTAAEFLKRIDSGSDEFDMCAVGGEDSVRIMTVHASKGLEFPVVIASHAGKTFNKMDVNKGTNMLLDREFGFAFKSYDYTKMSTKSNIIRSFLLARYNSLAVKEEMRLFYVALTRAKYLLYITGMTHIAKEWPDYVSVIGASNMAAVLPDFGLPIIGPTDDDAFLAQCALHSGEALVCEHAPVDDKLADKIRGYLSFKYGYDTASPAKTSVTAVLKSMEGEDEEPPVPVIVDDYDATERAADAGVDPRERGDAYHHLMEVLDFEKCAISHIKDQKMQAVERGDITQKEADLIVDSNVSRVLEDEFFHIKGAEYYREQPFEFLVSMGGDGDEQTLVQGIIDVFAVTDEGVHLADYKVSCRGRASLAEKYRTQLELYSRAIELITGKKVLSKTLFNLSSGERVEVK